jgi:hypothetical protein
VKAAPRLPCIRRQLIVRRGSENYPLISSQPRQMTGDRAGIEHVLRSHRWLIAALITAILGFLATDAWLLVKRRTYQAEVQRLRASMTDLERHQADAIVAQERNKLRLSVALIRRQARMEPTLHLSVSIDSSAMYLEREGVLLRRMPVHVGPERRIGIAPDTVRLAPPRGVRSVARILTGGDAWQVPEWVYQDRGLPVPADTLLRGALGPAAILLEGGTILYSIPPAGPLSDSSYVLPGAVRARVEDLQAILPNLAPGMNVYFY